MQWKSSFFSFCTLLTVGSRSSVAFASNDRSSLVARYRNVAAQQVASPRGGATSTLAAPLSATNHTDAFVAEMSTSLEGQAENNKPLKIVFLSSDTGGGHRASAEALAKQFLLKYPGSTYELVDVWTDHGVLPYRTLVNSYKRMSAKPWQWRLFYHLSNNRLNQIGSDFHSRRTCGKRIRRRLEALDPDVVISVHPAMNFTPMKETQRLSKKHGKHIPFFTVVTDLGSAHMMWFQKHVDKLYVASERLRQEAKRRGRTPDENIVLTGLPIRYDFVVQHEKLGDRTTKEGRRYQHQIRKQVLGEDQYDPDKRMVLIMGGGEGVGGLSEIVNQLYVEFTNRGIDATICVVCGRNEKLRADLAVRNWDAVIAENEAAAITMSEETKKKRFGFFGLFGRKKQKEVVRDVKQENTEVFKRASKINVIGLGFVSNMAEYMAASDVLVTKAGPGTIAEATSVGLPLMLTSFLPGQEAGNVDMVLESGYGAYNNHPVEIAWTVSDWLMDDTKLRTMSKAAQAAGNPYAASEIVEDIGTQTQSWLVLNGQRQM